MMLVRKVARGFGGFFLSFFFFECRSGLFTKGINLSTLFKISIVGLYFFFDLTDKPSDIYPSFKTIENHAVV